MSENSPRKHTVLLVDDDPSIRLLFSKALAHAGFEVQLAENGREAIECLQQRMPDLVVLDLVMPEQEGIETLVVLHQQFPMLPVIAVSGATGAKEYLKVANLLGANRTLHKPVKAEELVQAVTILLGGASQAALGID